MSWYTDAASELPSGLERTAALLMRRRPTLRAGHVARPWVPASWLDSRPGESPGQGDAANGMLPALSFSEDEIAQIAAAVARSTECRVRAACADDTAAAQALVLERMAASLAQAVCDRRDDEARCLHQLLDLADAIARALTVDTDAGCAGTIVETVRSLLTNLPSEAAARVVVADGHAEMLATALTQFTRRVGPVEVVGDARLPAGAVQVTWSGGWLEHAPAEIQRQLVELLAARRPVPAPIGATDPGDDHGPD